MTSPTRSGTRQVTRIASDIGSGRLAPESPVPSRPVPLVSLRIHNRYRAMPDEKRMGRYAAAAGGGRV